MTDMAQMLGVVEALAHTEWQDCLEKKGKEEMVDKKKKKTGVLLGGTPAWMNSGAKQKHVSTAGADMEHICVSNNHRKSW